MPSTCEPHLESSRDNGILAVVDETSPADRNGIFYVVTGTVLLDQIAARVALDTVISRSRKRPFHWVREGPTARTRMVELLLDIGAVAYVVVHYPTGRRQQETARRAALFELVPLLVSKGATELIIESRSAVDDGRDRQSLVEASRLINSPFLYRWDSKANPLLWIADSVCGIVKEYLLGEDTNPFEMLHAGRVLSEVQYRQLDLKNA